MVGVAHDIVEVVRSRAAEVDPREGRLRAGLGVACVGDIHSQAVLQLEDAAHVGNLQVELQVVPFARIHRERAGRHECGESGVQEDVSAAVRPDHSQDIAAGVFEVHHEVGAKGRPLNIECQVELIDG